MFRSFIEQSVPALAVPVRNLRAPPKS